MLRPVSYRCDFTMWSVPTLDIGLRGLLMEEPPGHCVMCEWCAAQSIPSHKADKTRPAKSSNCPLCRKRVKQKVSVAPNHS